MFTRHPIPAGIYDTFRMPRGSSYVLNSSIDMILSKNNRYVYNIAGCRHKINVRNPRKKFSFLVYINKNIWNVLLFPAPGSPDREFQKSGRRLFPSSAASLCYCHIILPCACPSAATHHSHPRKKYQYTYLLPCVPGQDRSNTNCLPPDTTLLP